MARRHSIRRSIAMFIVLLLVIVGVAQNPNLHRTEYRLPPSLPSETSSTTEALPILHTLDVKGRASKTGYTRSQFGPGWSSLIGCDTRNQILRRDLTVTVVNEKCQVVTGILLDPYSGKTIQFERGSVSSQAVQIDHVVPLSDAWQKGAQQLPLSERLTFANDPLNLLAVDGKMNQQKSDGDAATWLPPNKAFRCQYIARQIAVKKKYQLWVTKAEKEAMLRILSLCPGQQLPIDRVDAAPGSTA